MSQGDVESALGDFDRALESDPEYVMAYNNRGIAKLGKGDIEGALADFDQAIKANANRPEAYANRGLVRLQQGNRAEAQRDFARSISLRPSVKVFIERRVGEIGQQN